MSKLFDKGREAVKKGNYDYAIELFQEELKMYPDNLEARKALRGTVVKKCKQEGSMPSGFSAYMKGLGPFLSVMMAKMKKDWDKMMIASEAFLAKAPREKSMLRNLATAAREGGYLDTAIWVYEGLREQDREDEDALRSLAQLYKAKGNIEKATAYYEALKKINPSDAEAAKAIRDLAASGSTRQLEEAKRKGSGSFRDVLADQGQSKKLEKASQRLKTKGQIKERIGELEQELQQESDNAKKWARLGDLKTRLGDWGGAKQAYENSLGVTDDPQVRDSLGNMYMRRFKREIKQAKKAGDKQKVAQTHKKMLQYGVKEWSRRVKKAPTELGLRYQLGEYLFKLKRHKEAMEQLQRASDDPRVRHKAQLLLGQCFIAQELPKLAIGQFEKAREGAGKLEGTAKEATYYMGVAYQKMGQLDDAVQEFSRIVEVDLEYKDVMKRMRALQD